ncbi:MAG: hypothetical protein NXY57DRAFT_967015 [Lentinula lateritia]|nr:MAG: hypothetical protein NXY57DRAFT_967015 [Lentinula lateritia]
MALARPDSVYEIDQLSLQRAPSKSRSIRSTANVVDFEMPKALKRPRDTTFSVRSLYDDMKRGLIDVNPEYQRDVVWKAEKQIMLIDSVFTNHYMPPIIFSVSYEENGTEVTKICLDGKQRLTSLQLFIDGVIPLKHPETSKLWWFKNDESSTSKTHRNIIPERIQQSFFNRQIRCTEYEELDEEDEREIFRRVQLGMALSTAEKLRVRSTRHAKFINELRELYVTESGLAAPSFRWDRSRDADYRCLAQAVYALSKWGPERNTTLKTTGTLSQVEKWLDDDTSPMSGEFADQVKQAFSILVSPIEIIGVVILIYVHSIIAPPFEKLTLPELSAAVAQMRQDVRREHKDIRLNDRVGKTLVAYVKAYRKPALLQMTVPPASRILSIGELTGHHRAKAVEISTPAQAQIKSTSPKRKREPSLSDQHGAKRLTTKLSTPTLAPLPASGVVPSNDYRARFSSFLSAPVPYPTPPAATSHLPHPLSYGAPPPYIIGTSGYQHPMKAAPQPFVHSYPSYYGHVPPPPLPPPQSQPPVPTPLRSEASPSSSTSSSEPRDELRLVYPPIAVKAEPSPSPSPATMPLDALRHLQELNKMFDRRPPSAHQGGPWQSYQPYSDSKY